MAAARTVLPFKLAVNGRWRRDIGWRAFARDPVKRTGSRAVRLTAKAAHKVLTVTEVE
jgi:hypothetical protein